MKKGIKKVVSLISAISLLSAITVPQISLLIRQYTSGIKDKINQQIVDGFGKVSVINSNYNCDENIKDYLINNIDSSYITVNDDYLYEADVIRVKQIFVDESCTDDSVISSDDYWNNTDSYDGFIRMNETMQMLYDPGDESDYYVSLINPMHYMSSVEFTRSNMLGELINNCFYDDDTGIAYIDKQAVLNDGLGSVQAELFYLCESNPVNDISINLDINNYSEGVCQEGIVICDATEDFVQIKIADGKAANELKTDYLSVKINGYDVDSKYYWYNQSNGSIVIRYPASGIYSIDISSNRPSLLARTWEYINDFWSAPTVYADSFDDMTVASGTWSSSGGVPASGTTFEVSGVTVEYGDFTANGQTYIPSPERNLTDADLAAMADAITSGNTASLNGQYFSAGNFQVYRVTIPETDVSTGGISYHIPASTYILHCSHSTVNAISGEANRDPGKVIINIMGTANGFALIGMFSEFPGYTQEGVGYFRVPFETDSTAMAHVSVHKMYEGRDYSDAVFALVPEDSISGSDVYGTAATSNVRTFVRGIFDSVGNNDAVGRAHWVADIINCRGAKQTVAGVVKSLFSVLFADKVHSVLLDDGTTSLRFNTPEDCDYVMAILINSLNSAYGQGPVNGWSYVATFPGNLNLDLYRAIEDVLYSPVYESAISPDILANFYVNPEVILITTGAGGIGERDIFLGNYTPGTSGTITRNYQYRELIGGIDSGRVDNGVYRLSISFTSFTNGDSSITSTILDPEGNIISNQTGDVALVNSLGATQGDFINAGAPVYENASITLHKIGDVFSGVNVEQRVINGETFIVNSPFISVGNVSRADYSIVTGNNSVLMSYDGSNYVYGNLSSSVGNTSVYRISETAAPAGYALSNDYWEVYVTRSRSVRNGTEVFTDSISQVKYYRNGEGPGVNINDLNTPLEAYDSIIPVDICVVKSFDEVVGDMDYAQEMNKCVFGLYSRDVISLAGGVQIAPDTLIAVTGINEIIGSGSGTTGIAHFGNIPNGNYYVRELRGSDRFILDTSVVDISVDRSRNTSYEADFTNHSGSLSVIKEIPVGDDFDVDSVAFELYRDDNGDGQLTQVDELIATGNTNSDGTVSWNQDVSSLALGNYILLENWTESTVNYYDGTTVNVIANNISEGWYKLTDNSYIYPFTLRDYEGVRYLNLTVVNDSQTGMFSLVKNITVEGDISDITCEIISGTNVVARGTLTTNGVVNSSSEVLWDYDSLTEQSVINLPVGVYELREYLPESNYHGAQYTYMCPEGFTVSDDGAYFYKSIYVTNSNGQINRERIGNTRCEGSLTLNKVSEDENVSGIRFRLFYRGDGDEPCLDIDRIRIPYSDDQVCFVTDENGVINIEHLPYGWYEIEEIAPEGTRTVWVGETTDSGNKLVHLTSNQATASCYVTAMNVINVSCYVNKYDQWTMEAVGGASFDLYRDLNCNGVLDDDEKVTFAHRADVDGDGVTVFEDLAAGYYLLRESTTVDGYYINPNLFSVIISDSTNPVVDVEEEPYRTRIVIYKVDADDVNHLLSGASFVIYEDVNENGIFDEDIDVPASTYNGKIVPASVSEIVGTSNPVYISDYLRSGHYLVCEVTRPAGFDYINCNQFTSVVIDGVDTTIDGFVPQDIEVTISNICRGTIHITKVDEESPDNKLSGAIFTVYRDINGNGVIDSSDMIVGVMTEETTGEYYLRDLPYGEYLVIESESPANYVRRDDVWAVNIIENNRVYDISDSDFEGLYNRFSGSVTLHKVSAIDYNLPVSGAEFAIYRDSGSGVYDETSILVDSVTDNGDGIYHYDGLSRGRYYIREISAPDYYTRDTGIYAFIISNNNPNAVVDNFEYYGVPGLFIEGVPEISTTLTNDIDGTHFIGNNTVVNLTDTVVYEGLEPGVEYVITGTLINKSTGEIVDNMEPVSISFVPESADGVVNVPFELNTSWIEGEDVVAYEKLTLNGSVKAVHEDINYEGQTVSLLKKAPPATGEDKGILFYTIAGVLSVISSVVVIGYVSMGRDYLNRKDR